jgi:hypothetical protein
MEMIAVLARAAAGHGILFWLGILAIVAGVIALVMGRILPGVILIIVGLMLAFGGFAVSAG